MIMSREEVEQWLRDQPESKTLTESDIAHVIRCMFDLIQWYEGQDCLGHFLTALVENNFIEAVTRADGTNTKALTLYAKFLYNVMPADYRSSAIQRRNEAIDRGRAIQRRNEAIDQPAHEEARRDYTPEPEPAE